MAVLGSSLQAVPGQELRHRGTRGQLYRADRGWPNRPAPDGPGASAGDCGGKRLNTEGRHAEICAY
jgi:hypothetical protein